MADNLDIFMHAIRIQESGDDYTATNASGHFGAYQFDISTWVSALSMAGLQYVLFAGVVPSLAPPSVQDAAARALMSKYLGEFGNSFYNVAEAWYGGPGVVGHPDIGGGPGFPTVGQYASQVIAIYNRLGGPGGGSAAAPPPASPYTAATLLELLLALNQEATQRGLGDAHTREQAAAGDAAEAVGRSLGDAHSREQAAAGIAVEVNSRIEAVNNTRQQAAAGIAVEVNSRIEAVNNTRQQAAAGILAEATERGLGDAHSREQAAALTAAEAVQRGLGDDNSRQQAAAGIKALDVKLTAQVDTVLKYAQTIPGLIDTRAANGYDPTLQARASLLTKLLDTAVAHEPLIAGLVSKLATAIIDLAGLEDPVLRIAMQLILKQVIDKLGINTALGAILNDLVGGILGGGPPKTLQDVTADIGKRLNSLEEGQAELAPLAPEADQLHEMGTLIFDAALLGYFAAAVAAPVATADDTVAVFATVTDPLLAPVRALLGM
jgi:Transglycosylase-like domain